MWWYRRHQRFAGLSALFALGLQLAVSFAHVHVEGARPPFGVSVLDATSQDRSSTEFSYAPGALHDDYCAICAAIGLLSNGLNGEPPVISLREFVCFAPRPQVSKSRISVARFYPFRTRAPPVA
jgi:hypothetical protein